MTARPTDAAELLTFLRRRLAQCDVNLRRRVLEELLNDLEAPRADGRKSTVIDLRRRRRADKLLTYLRIYVQERGIAPSHREIGDVLGSKDAHTVREVLAQLEADGAIKVIPNVGRGIKILATTDGTSPSEYGTTPSECSCVVADRELCPFCAKRNGAG